MEQLLSPSQQLMDFHQRLAPSGKIILNWYSNPKSFVNFLLPPREFGEGWGGVNKLRLLQGLLYFFKGFNQKFPFYLEDQEKINTFFSQLPSNFIEVFHPDLITSSCDRKLTAS